MKTRLLRETNAENLLDDIHNIKEDMDRVYQYYREDRIDLYLKLSRSLRCLKESYDIYCECLGDELQLEDD